MCDDYIIRTATIDDLDEIHNVESECFSKNEAATKKQFEERLTYYPTHFWLIFDDDKLIAFIDGFTTNKKDLTDEMFEDASLHDESGDWQMIFGLNTRPNYRKRGLAGKLVNHLIDNAKNENRSGVVLTCKEELISYYSRFGFVDEGISESKHGGAVWHQMRLTF
ncbi:MAG: GNAT family N-acetyltransferase [Methanobrevibacter sp.]|uniref:GNAT family N-acetyltransferase n=1 Tax=Methanobrevibacter sp. TaxID=66852 RepID=UPI0025D52C65|nr:GNAT family N-acetyltransferase [Methanobrevibacter sp.]MBR0272242.1 GNAT family N-acetyltransferase [Methanobrevibacter sp.]